MGRWIAFLDSDDQWRPEKLEKQMAAARRNPDTNGQQGVLYDAVYGPGSLEVYAAAGEEREEEVELRYLLRNRVDGYFIIEDHSL